MDTVAEHPTQTVYKLHFPSKQQLYAAYMPFIQNGGLFIKTQKAHPLGEQINIEITLLDDKQAYKVQGGVVWMTPVGAQRGKVAGIGIQLSGKEGARLNNAIETFLVGMIESGQKTDTI